MPGFKLIKNGENNSFVRFKLYISRQTRDKIFSSDSGKHRGYMNFAKFSKDLLPVFIGMHSDERT
jgi:hypothetical protein